MQAILVQIPAPIILKIYTHLSMALYSSHSALMQAILALHVKDQAAHPRCLCNLSPDLYVQACASACNGWNHCSAEQALLERPEPTIAFGTLFIGNAMTGNISRVRQATVLEFVFTQNAMVFSSNARISCVKQAARHEIRPTSLEPCLEVSLNRVNSSSSSSSRQQRSAIQQVRS